MSKLKKLSSHISRALKKHIVHNNIINGELTICVKNSEILEVLEFLKNDAQCNFHMLMDICGVDYLGDDERFEVVYNMLCLTNNTRIRIKTRLKEGVQIHTAEKLFSCATWFEREIFDMYGISFTNSLDERRILTDYGFEGHPLRKDFPLTGHVEVRYDEKQQKVIYEPVKLMQEFRNFDFDMPWEQTEYILPGDEKATK